MKPSLIYQTTATLLGLGLALSAGQAAAVTFDQKDINPAQVIAVAVPLSQGERYNLLILEQLTNARPCWQDNTATPGAIDPLLLQFDFTNICGRSTDSNGYSIRIAGEDKALDYRLSIQKQGNHLTLMGLPSRSNKGPALEIARTETLAPGFLKLILNPEWRFAKRTYQGKALGHIYLTRDTAPSSDGGIQTPYPLNLAENRTPQQKLLTSSSLLTSSGPFQGNLKAPSRSLSKPSAYSGSVEPITAPIQIQVPEPLAASHSPRASISPLLPPAEPNNNGLPVLTGGILPVPTANIPMGRAGNEPDLIDASTPGLNLNAMAPGADTHPEGGLAQPSVLQETASLYRFRVFVNPADPIQQRTVKTLVPDSFRSSYQGQSVLQVGAFKDRSEADEVIDLLNRNGIKSIVSASN